MIWRAALHLQAQLSAGVKMVKQAVRSLIRQCGEEGVTALHVQQALRVVPGKNSGSTMVNPGRTLVNCIMSMLEVEGFVRPHVSNAALLFDAHRSSNLAPVHSRDGICSRYSRVPWCVLQDRSETGVVKSWKAHNLDALDYFDMSHSSAQFKPKASFSKRSRGVAQASPKRR